MVAVLGVIAADRGLFYGLSAIVCAAVAGWFFGSGRRLLVWLLCAALAVGVFLHKKSEREAAERELVGSGGVFSAEMLSDGKGIAGFWSAPARLIGGRWKGTQVWWEGTRDAPVAGSIVEARGNFLALQPARNPGEFDEAAWRRRKGMVADFHSQTIHVETGWWASLGAKIRRGFRDAVTLGLAEDSQQAKVIRAIVIGESPSDADQLVAAFRNSGTLHIFSVSGMHVAMVGSIGWFLLRKLGVSRRVALLAILPLIFGYSWISGNSAPAVRSAWMMAVFLLAFVFRRKPDLLNALGAVLLTAMLWDGNLLFQPGVQLSYGVVAAIAIGTAWASRAFAWIGRKEEYLPDDMIVGWRARWLEWRKKLALFLGVSTAAWIGSTPLTIYHFGLVTPIALIATGVLGPIVYALLTASLLAAAIHPISPKAAARVNQLNGKLADACVWSAEKLSAIPGSHLSTRGPGEPMLLVYDLEYGAGAAVFSGGSDGAVMLDCGDRPAFKSRILKSLQTLGIQPDSVVLSHPDGGHLGGGADVWTSLPIRQAVLPVELSRSLAFKAWVDDAPKAGVSLIFAKEIQSLAMPDGARLEVLHVPNPRSQNVLADERVAIFRLNWRGWKILLTSDSGMGIERQLLQSGQDLRADVIIAGKHRSDASLGDEFLDAVQPKLIVASHSEFPKEERLDPKRVDYWRSRGIKVISQGVSGGVTIRVAESGDLVVEGYVDHSEIRFKR